MGQTSLIATQCMFLAGVYFMATMDILAGWKMFAQTVTHSLAYSHCKNQPDTRQASSEYEPVMDSTLATLEESVYWAGLKSELLV